MKTLDTLTGRTFESAVVVSNCWFGTRTKANGVKYKSSSKNTQLICSVGGLYEAYDGPRAAYVGLAHLER